MGSYTSRDIPPRDNQDSMSDGYEDEDSPTDEDMVKSARNDDYEERISPTFNEVGGNFPEIADLLLASHNPLALANWETLRKKDKENSQTQQQKRENENDRDNAKSANEKVQALDSATSTS